jgi:spermidine/putrescine transport system substrate-binding protein
MNTDNQNNKIPQLRMLAPESFRTKLTRRAIFQMGTAAAGLAIVAAACGGDDGGSGGGTDTTEGPGSTEAPGGTLASGDWSRVINAASGTLAMYTWGDYNDPVLVGQQAEDAIGVSMKVDYFNSNEDLITKLSTSGGASGFDIVVPTGPYVPQMIEKGLIQKLDTSLIPNMVNVDPNYLAQEWDPNNEYSVCKNWGTTGFFWDSTVITRDLVTWADFFDACMNEASGNCSVIDTGPNVWGAWCWANGKDWTSTDTADLDACEAFLVDELAQHIKKFDSYPSTALAEGAYALSMAWNGDARQAYFRIAEAGGDPSVWKWALGSPDTELFMDTYCIAAGAPNPEAAHAWINWVLVPEISIQDLQYHGYHTGMKSMPQLIEELAPDVEFADMIFFDDAAVATMHTQVINEAIDRQVEILNKMKAKAGA